MDTSDSADVVQARTCKNCRWLIAPVTGYDVARNYVTRWVHITTTGTIYCDYAQDHVYHTIGEPED